MIQIKRKPAMKKSYWFGGIFLLVSMVVFIALIFLVQFRDLKETFLQAEKTAAFLETECEKFDNYNRGNSARSLQNLLDTAIGLQTFVEPSKLKDSAFLKEYIHTEHVSGVLILDRTFSVIAQADMDDKDSYEIWKETLKDTTIQDLVQYPEKTYMDQITIDDIPYDFAAVPSSDGEEIFICYSSRLKPGSDPYEYTIANVLKNNNFYKNPIALIADQKQILSTNSEEWKQLGEDAYHQLNTSVKWKEKELTRIAYENQKWYGLRHVYGDYVIYVIYPAKEVFSNRINMIAGGFMLYLTFCLVILLIQRHFDQVSLYEMEKQLRIIDSISTTYDSTFLLHLDRKELEPLNVSERLDILFREHPKTADFFFAVCAKEVDPVYRLIMKRFLEVETIGTRLKNHASYLEMEVKDIYGAWYSVMLIPQRYDESGNIQEVIITTKDVTMIKQAEELSFKDQLTGLYNRNYLENRTGDIVNSNNYPVSIIMADCNYLKRTNDTLGHEYGDLLLQRVAASIKAVIPKNCTAIRVGGDEFVILCAKYSKEQAQRLIAKIRQKLVENSDELLQVSVSFGVYTIEDNRTSFAQAYQFADQEMYKDKVASKANRT